MPPGVLKPFYDQLVADGYIDRDGDLLTVTPAGEAEAVLVRQAWRSWLTDELSDWFPKEQTADENALMAQQAIERIITRVIDEEQRVLAPA